jgi:hypothetical protein
MKAKSLVHLDQPMRRQLGHFRFLLISKEKKIWLGDVDKNTATFIIDQYNFYEQQYNHRHSFFLWSIRGHAPP